MNLDALITQAKNVECGAVILKSHKNWVDNSPLRSWRCFHSFLKRTDLDRAGDGRIRMEMQMEELRKQWITSEKNTGRARFCIPAEIYGFTG